MNSRIVVIGNGIAANTAASVIRKHDHWADITMLSAEAFPEYSACILANYLSREINRQRVFLRSSADYARDNIKILLGQKAVGLDTSAKSVLTESGDIPYDKAVIATGSTPVVPPIEGVNKQGVFTFKSLADADKIAGHVGERAAVIGSGPVGIEAAIALKKRGYQVSLVELLGWILPRVLDEYPALLVKDLLEQKGVQVFTRERVIRIVGTDKVEGVVTDKREIRCDLVIMVAGMKPEVSLAQQAGIRLGHLGGIKTDDHMLTSAKDVYACGDCVQAKERVSGEDSLSLLWHNARYQGKVAGSNCSGFSRTYPGSQDITVVNFWGTYAVSLGKTLVSIGGGGAEVAERHLGRAYYRLVLSQGKLVGAQSLGHPRDMGILFNLIRREDTLAELGKAIWSRSQFARRGWWCKIPRYIETIPPKASLSESKRHEGYS